MPLDLVYYPQVNRKTAVVRYMFFNREDVLWFKPVELKTKWGRRGHIKEPLGGLMGLSNGSGGWGRVMVVVLIQNGWLWLGLKGKSRMLKDCYGNRKRLVDMLMIQKVFCDL